MRLFPSAIVVALALAVAPAVGAQVIDLTVNDIGIAIGDARRTTGIRINYRDDRMQHVRGINATVWAPYQPANGVVDGVALGLPLTGARQINGLTLALAGASADESINGIAIAPIGLGAGGSLRGLMVGGLGLGAGGSIEGVAISLLGMGSGGRIRGLMIAGLGLGSGGTVEGISIAGLGVGGGGSVRGLSVGGLGVGVGGSVKGITVAGLGVGAGGGVSGITVAGVGVGSGGRVSGLTVAGLGVGAPEIEGITLALGGVGGMDVRGAVLAGLHLKIEDDGYFKGGAISAFSRIKGEQHGLTIGLLNYARELRGVQVGVINISENGGRRRVLPLLNVGR